MIILGIDPGLRLTGYGVIGWDGVRGTLLDAGVVRLDAKTSIAQRLVELSREVGEILDEFHPDVAAVEEVYSHYAHPKTAVLMAHARGVILHCIASRRVELKELAANRIKQSLTGHGHAAKHQMQRAVQAEFNLAAPPQPPDVADALAIALCCGRMSARVT